MLNGHVAESFSVRHYLTSFRTLSYNAKKPKHNVWATKRTNCFLHPYSLWILSTVLHPYIPIWSLPIRSATNGKFGEFRSRTFVRPLSFPHLPAVVVRVSPEHSQNIGNVRGISRSCQTQAAALRPLVPVELTTAEKFHGVRFFSSVSFTCASKSLPVRWPSWSVSGVRWLADFDQSDTTGGSVTIATAPPMCARAAVTVSEACTLTVPETQSPALLTLSGTWATAGRDSRPGPRSSASVIVELLPVAAVAASIRAASCTAPPRRSSLFAAIVARRAPSSSPVALSAAASRNSATASSWSSVVSCSVVVAVMAVTPCAGPLVRPFSGSCGNLADNAPGPDH